MPAVSSVSTASSVTAATRTERTTHTSRFQWFEDRVMGVFMYEMETVTTTEVERRGHEVQRIDRY